MHTDLNSNRRRLLNASKPARRWASPDTAALHPSHDGRHADDPEHRWL